MESIWSRSCQMKERGPLRDNIETEVAVVGAGMAGILTASVLQREGCRVVVLDAGRIAGGQTQNTTAKITSQHGMIYQKLIQTMGEEKARQYADANEQAVAAYKKWVAEEGIDCDFEEKSAYLYGDCTGQLQKEAEAAAALGLPASYVEEREVPLPFPVGGAVRFEHQAQFHPLKFIKALADSLTVYENTAVRTVEGHHVLHAGDGSVKAEKIVFACHFPFVNFPGLYFARMHQERSYVLALKNAAQVDGIFIGAEENSYSFRNAGELLLLGGGNHRTGENKEGGRYEGLWQKARIWYPQCREVARWSAQDCMTPDSVPYIGRYAAGEPDWYVATGFQKWGMTTSMVAAMLLRDLIGGKKSPYEEAFDPGRFNVETVPGVATEGGQAVKGLVKRIFQIPAEAGETIPAGHGGIVLLNGEKCGVYKDRDGNLYAVDIRCPHLGCQLEWNPDEHSWDCPCHGSRFDYLGRWISGPAQENLKDE